MPAFIKDGPDIPERLLQAQEDGRVVFFCGAGISYAAGLPGYSDLVKRLYKEAGVIPNPVQQTAMKKHQYDTAFGLLEGYALGKRKRARSFLSQILSPNLDGSHAKTMHEALLTLARSREGKLRLVTTNFDRIFEEILGDSEERFVAPLLPVPKSRWCGLVYLHGLLPSEPDPDKLNRLVLSSGDFGLAYLTERWAARFVGELFRNFSVCFVGYSIGDPVLRYMMDALAADRLMGESSPEMFAFGGCSKGKETETYNEWQAKNVTPIMYWKHREHVHLRRTLQAWAEVYRDGASGKRMILAQHAASPPLTSSREDYANGRVLWALTDGSAAKFFADLDPVPPLEWIDVLSVNQFGIEDLPRFGINPDGKEDKNLSFSMIRRPALHRFAPEMCLVDTGARFSRWDDVMRHLARWLTRHLNDPRLVLWLAERGGRLHDVFVQLVKDRIDDVDRWQRTDNRDEMECILKAAPNAIPIPFMRTLWRLFLTGRVKTSGDRAINLYALEEWIRRDGFTPSFRLRFLELIRPQVKLRGEFFPGNNRASVSSQPNRTEPSVGCEVVLFDDHVHDTLQEFRRGAHWQAALPGMLNDFTALLRDALDLMGELGGANDQEDRSYFDQPSISEHPQNRGFHDWTALIELTRDAWLAKAQTDPSRARHVAQEWMSVPYPLFKRLAFFAAANSEAVPPATALGWLLDDDHWWLWSDETEREVMRLLVALAPKLDSESRGKLEEAILKGPPREMFRVGLDTDKLNDMLDHEVWLRLAKVKNTGATLGPQAETELGRLAARNPEWVLARDERDEFPFWIESGWGAKADGSADEKPIGRASLVEWLRKHPKCDRFSGDDLWGRICRDDLSTAVAALDDLMWEDLVYGDRWAELLQVATEEDCLDLSWPSVPAVLMKASNELLIQIDRYLGRWLASQAEVFKEKEEVFFGLIRRLFELDYGDDQQEPDPVIRAINHPVGLATKALLNWWYRQELREAKSLEDQILNLFTELCDTNVNKFHYGRVVLATHVISLFRVDEEWTRNHLLPLFDWRQSNTEAYGAWGGFLQSPRLYGPLLSEIKGPFLETAAHYSQLGHFAEQFAGLLALTSLLLSEVFTERVLAEATNKLPEKGLVSALQTVTRALKGAGDQSQNYWRNRVAPYLKQIWPKSSGKLTFAVSENFARLFIAAGEAFPEAMHEFHDWLKPVQYPGSIIHGLHANRLCTRFPSDALALLAAVIGENPGRMPGRLRNCLIDIREANPELAEDPRFQRLQRLTE